MDGNRITKKNKLTIILPLLDKHQYTSVWIKNNIFHEFNYIVADGSKSDDNEKLIKEIKHNNLQYIKYFNEVHVKDWMYKMANSSLKSTTEYTMTVDNDDFINPVGINKCIKALENQKKYDFASGNIHFVKQIRNKYKLLTSTMRFSGYTNKHKFELIKTYFDKTYKTNTGYVWYSIYKTKIYQKVWNELYKSNIFDVHVSEYLNTQLSFCFGNFLPLNCNHYIRLMNPSTRTSNIHFANKNKPHLINRILFEEEDRKNIVDMYLLISKYNKIFDKELREIYIEYFTKERYKAREISLLKFFSKSILDFFYIIKIRTSMLMVPLFGLNRIKNIINSCYNIKNFFIRVT